MVYLVPALGGPTNRPEEPVEPSLPEAIKCARFEREKAPNEKEEWNGPDPIRESSAESLSAQIPSNEAHRNLHWKKWQGNTPVELMKRQTNIEHVHHWIEKIHR